MEKSKDEEETYDNLFTNLSTKTMVHVHIIFWLKRVILVLLVIISPYFINYYSIIVGFIFSLIFTSFEFETPATANKLEPAYTVLFNAPIVLVSFISMLMEGHYISYLNKYMISQVMMFMVLIIYLLVIPLRFYDFYNYRKKQEEKKMQRYTQKLSNTSNITSTIGMKDKSLFISENLTKNDDFMSPAKTNPQNNQKLVTETLSVFKLEEENSSSWKKKKSTYIEKPETISSQAFSSFYHQTNSNGFDKAKNEDNFSKIVEDYKEEVSDIVENSVIPEKSAELMSSNKETALQTNQKS